MPNSNSISSLKNNFFDVKVLAGDNVSGSNGTFNSFKFHEAVTCKIDYVFISKKANINVKKCVVLTDSKDLEYLSDHFPIFTKIKII